MAHPFPIGRKHLLVPGLACPRRASRGRLARHRSRADRLFDGAPGARHRSRQRERRRAGDPAAAHGSGPADRLDLRPHAALRCRACCAIRSPIRRCSARRRRRPSGRCSCSISASSARCPGRCPVAAIAGALLSIALVVAVAGRSATIVVLVLAGLAVGSLAGAGDVARHQPLAQSLRGDRDRVLAPRLLRGPIASSTCSWRHPSSWSRALLLLSAAPGLRALALGEETARSLGVDVARLRLLIVAAAAIGTGASVAVAGSIGFVGLVAPHLVRPFVGYDPARTLVPAGLAGRGSSARRRLRRAPHSVAAPRSRSAC